MVYPMELSKGDRDQKISKLSAFFKKHHWEHSWDFNAKACDYWYDVEFEGRPILQVEFGVPVTTMLADIKEFAKIKDAPLDTYLELLAKKVPDGKSLYIKK